MKRDGQATGEETDLNGAKFSDGSAQPRPPKGILGLKLEGEPVVSRIKCLNLAPFETDLIAIA